MKLLLARDGVDPDSSDEGGRGRAIQVGFTRWPSHHARESIQQLTTEYRHGKLLFNMDESSLERDREQIQLSLSSVHHIQPLSSPPSSYSLAKTRLWLTCNSHNTLFLPLDRRPSHFIVKDNILAIGRRSGRLTFLEFKPDLNPLCNV